MVLMKMSVILPKALILLEEFSESNSLNQSFDLIFEFQNFT